MKRRISGLASAALCALLLAGCTARDTPDPGHSPDLTQMPPALETPAPQPVYARQIAEGTYGMEVLSSSSMFRVTDAQLTVDADSMSCVITMSGQGYGKLYLGTGEQALADTEERYIPAVLNADGAVTFDVPVEALDWEIDCAAWSIRKQSWYDRVLSFPSASLPAGAITPTD